MGRLASIFAYDTTPTSSLVECRLCIAWRHLATSKPAAMAAAADHEERCHADVTSAARNAVARQHAREHALR